MKEVSDGGWGVGSERLAQNRETEKSKQKQIESLGSPSSSMRSIHPPPSLLNSSSCNATKNPILPRTKRKHLYQRSEMMSLILSRLESTNQHGYLWVITTISCPKEADDQEGSSVRPLVVIHRCKQSSGLTDYGNT